MQILKKSHIEVLELFRKSIFLSETIRKISVILNKDYPTVYNAIKELEKGNILKIKKIGKSNVCEFSFSQEAISTLSFLEEQKALSSKIPNIQTILEFKEFLDNIIIITGSYASGKQTKNSDIDLVIITKENPDQKQRLLENLTDLMHPKVHPIVISYKDFVDMLLSKEENFGKEIFKNKLLFRNASRYYNLINEAIENGFKG